MVIALARQWQGDDGARQPDKHRQGEGDATVASPQSQQGRGKTAMQWRMSMINAGRVRRVQQRSSAKIKKTKMD
jgi:hypothetical protein